MHVHVYLQVDLCHDSNVGIMENSYRTLNELELSAPYFILYRTFLRRILGFLFQIIPPVDVDRCGISSQTPAYIIGVSFRTFITRSVDWIIREKEREPWHTRRSIVQGYLLVLVSTRMVLLYSRLR